MAGNMQINKKMFCEVMELICILKDNKEFLTTDINNLVANIDFEINEKINKMIKRNLYTKYKTAPTEEEKEKARKEYLKNIGMRKDFTY